MLRYLIYIGLIGSPFLVVKGYDGRASKALFALGIAFVIALYGLCRGNIKPFPNQWAIAFIAWTFLITPFYPKWMGLHLNAGGNMDGLWNFKTLTFLIVYFLALTIISSVYFSERVINLILKIITCSGALMAFYVCLQAIGIDPLFHLNKEVQGIDGIPGAKLVGTLGHPTIVSAFIAVCMPMAWYLKKYVIFFIMAFAVLITQSNVAIVSAIGGSGFYLCVGNKYKMIAAIIVLVTLSFLALEMHLAGDSGRFNLWATAFNDMKSNPITFLTGYGLGSFAYLFSPLMHPNDPYWPELHNEYFEICWGIGIPGMFLMVRSIYWVFQKTWGLMADRTIKCFMSSFVVMVICACGNFIWHLGTFCFYSLVIVGLLVGLIRRQENVRSI